MDQDAIDALAQPLRHGLVRASDEQRRGPGIEERVARPDDLLVQIAAPRLAPNALYRRAELAVDIDQLVVFVQAREGPPREGSVALHARPPAFRQRQSNAIDIGAQGSWVGNLHRSDGGCGDGDAEDGGELCDALAGARIGRHAGHTEEP